jgi:cytochrome c biogenesis protein CcmG/thiol:disulfide interchange protein DsbE
MQRRLRTMRRLPTMEHPEPPLPTRRRFPALLMACSGEAAVAVLGLGAAWPACADSPRAAPPLSATLLDGRSFTLQQAAGKVLIVNFWATWCAPCRVELPALEAFRQRYRDRGLQILAISLDDARQLAAVREALQGIGFDAALATQASFDGYGRIGRLPTTFVIDRAGRLRGELSTGAAPLDLAWLERHVAPLIES